MFRLQVHPHWLLSLALALCGCGLGAPPDMASCEAVADPDQQSECRQRAMAAISDDPERLRAAIEVCSDPITRDLLRLELVADDPELSLELCPSMEGAEAERWCTSLQGRSHLWKTGDEPGDKRH
jgi:predicted small lipoprotein YifL